MTTTVQPEQRTRIHAVEGGGGLRLHVREWGKADGPPILFIHGWSQNHLCWAEQYESGEAGGSEVVSQARAEAKIVRGMGPTDFALEQTQRLLVGMLTEYARAVQLQEHHGDAGPHMYRAYGLANYAHNILARAQAPLLKLGCDISPLL